MAYVATRGGEKAIKRAEFLHRALNGQFDAAFVQAVERNLPYLVDRVMGEGSLYAPEMAALALAQTGGDLYEAVLLVRAYRSTLPRLAYSEPINEDKLLTVRRISAAFKDIPGGQILGPTLDYSHRILRTEVIDGENGASDPEPDLAEKPAPATCPPVSGWQRLNGLLDDLPEQEPVNPADLPDVTREPIAFPASREHRLQSLSRADTGGILALGYAGMRGYGLAHPTVNEVKLAYADVQLQHPLTGVVFTTGRIRVSQAEIVSSGAEGLELGFCATMGWNEVKTIAAAMLDVEMNKPSARAFHTDEFVLYHTEPVEASGFCIHFKLPHYVTFNSALDSIRRVKKRRNEETRGDRLQEMITSTAKQMSKEMAR
jgi:alpha-D-ribose 1-methylphosphonate 5-triphosphate synthase subunit PhnI